MTADGWISLLSVAGMLITDGFFVWVALRLARLSPKLLDVQ